MLCVAPIDSTYSSSTRYFSCWNKKTCEMQHEWKKQARQTEWTIYCIDMCNKQQATNVPPDTGCPFLSYSAWKSYCMYNMDLRLLLILCRLRTRTQMLSRALSCSEFLGISGRMHLTAGRVYRVLLIAGAFTLQYIKLLCTPHVIYTNVY